MDVRYTLGREREEMGGGIWGVLGQKLEKINEVVECRTHVVVFR